MKQVFITRSPQETEEIGARLGRTMKQGVAALFGDMGAGKTVFVRGMAKGAGLSPRLVSSPTFALVQEYGGTPLFVHFDMYRVTSWEDLYSTGFFDYLDSGALLAVEWSENIENALPESAVRVRIERLSEKERRITVEGEIR